MSRDETSPSRAGLGLAFAHHTPERAKKMTTHIIHHTNTVSPVAQVLGGIADRLAGMTCARVSPVDVARAAHAVAPVSEERVRALEVLASYLNGISGFEEWLDQWAAPRYRPAVVQAVRLAAEHAWEEVTR